MGDLLVNQPYPTTPYALTDDEMDIIDTKYLVCDTAEIQVQIVDFADELKKMVEEIKKLRERADALETKVCVLAPQMEVAMHKASRIHGIAMSRRLRGDRE